MPIFSGRSVWFPRAHPLLHCHLTLWLTPKGVLLETGWEQELDLCREAGRGAVLVSVASSVPLPWTTSWPSLL